jgi:hypothetical protein
MADPNVDRIAILLGSVAAGAIVAAFSLGYIAHYDFGFSRREIRTPAVIAAAVIALLLAVEYFGTRLRKPK